METTSVSTLNVEPVACHACGKQLWVGVLGYNDPRTIGGMLLPGRILHLDFLGGTLEQDDTGAFRPSVKHQYQVHQHQPESGS